MLPVRLFIPNANNLTWLVDRFYPNRAQWTPQMPDDIQAYAIHLTCWISARDAQAFSVGDEENPAALFVFTDIVKDETAFVHVFRFDITAAFKDLVEAARATCKAVMSAHNLARLNGMTPCTNVPARVFAERVGFKIEGRHVKAIVTRDGREDAWSSALLPEYLDPVEDAILDKEE